MHTTPINWALWGALATALAGMAGSIITPIYGSGLATGVQVALQILSGFLVAIPGFHVSSVAASNAKASHLARLQMGGAFKQ